MKQPFPELSENKGHLYSMLETENKNKMVLEDAQCASLGLSVSRCHICLGRKKHPIIKRVCIFCGAEQQAGATN